MLGTSTIKVTTSDVRIKKITDCSKEDLMKAKGVGEKTASLIMENILSKKVTSITDVDSIKGIGPKTINEIKKYCY